MGNAVEAATILLRELYPIPLQSVEIAVIATDWGHWKPNTKTPKQTMDARLNERENPRIERLGKDFFRYKPDTRSLWPEKTSDKALSELLKHLRRCVEVSFIVSLCKVRLAVLSPEAIKKYIDSHDSQEACGGCPAKYYLDLKPKKENHIRRLKESCLIGAVGGWEVFNQDLVTQLAKEVSEKLGRHHGRFAFDRMPKSLQNCLRQFLDNAKAGNRYNRYDTMDKIGHKVFKDYVQVHVQKYNAPDTQRTDRLYRLCLNIPNISSGWCIEGKIAGDAKKEVDEYVDIRQPIAHGV